MWQDWTNAVLGIIVFALAFTGLDAMTLSWTLGILGAIIAVVGFWGAAETMPRSRSV
jgi:hypothetical protein